MLDNTKNYLDKNKELTEIYKTNIASIKQNIKDIKRDIKSNKKALHTIHELELDSTSIQNEYEETLEIMKERKEDLVSLKKEYKEKKKEIKKPVSFYVLLLLVIVIISGIIGSEIYLIKHHRNYENEYFAFRYNQERIFIDDYTEIANMWLITTGGGLYAPSSILIGFTDDAKDIEVEYALYAMQERLGGTKSEEESEIKANSAYDNYLLTLDNNTSYRILSKSMKKGDKILTILFANAGDLSEEEQAYLFQVYDTIKIN